MCIVHDRRLPAPDAWFRSVAYGIRAGLAAGILEQDDLNQWVKAGEEIAPQSQNQGLYDEMFQRYLALYSQTKDTVHFLSAQG